MDEARNIEPSSCLNEEPSITDEIPPIGTTFNESSVFPDEVTRRPTRRLTRSRARNQAPTYHLHNAFSTDGRYLALQTQTTGAGSAILRAETTTGDLTVVDATRPGDEHHFSEGNDLTLWRQAGLIVSKLGEASLLAYDVDSLDKRVLIERFDPDYLYGHPAGSADGRHLFIAKHRLPKEDSTHTVYLRIDASTGRVEEIFRDEGSANVHILAHPTDPDLLLIDRNFAPGWHGGSDGITTRAWLLRVSTGSISELRPRDPNNFQIHTNWSADGRFIYYHGLSGRIGQRRRESKRGARHDVTDRNWLRDIQGVDHYIGVSDLEGGVVWEAEFPFFHYGHTGSHSTQQAIVLDGLITPDLITAVHWQDLDSLGSPRIEILGRHGTYWHSGQQFDPHPVMSPDGRFLSYNRGRRNGRSDVHLLQLEA